MKSRAVHSSAKQRVTKPVSRKKEGIISRSFRLFHRLLLIGVVGSVALVVLFRFVPIPFSAYMVETKVRAIVSGKNSEISYKWVPIEKMAPYFPNAVIAAEDQRFLEHWGFDFKAIEKAVKYNSSPKAKKRGRVRGASTVSQQVAKNLFLWSDRSWVRKGFEVWFTLLIEVIWPKKRIMEVYLNIAQTGDRMFGVEMASKRYFKSSARQVSRSEAALLAACLPNPVRFSPKKPSAYIRKKQSWILGQMARLKRQGVYMELMSR